jgi:NAD+ diphosphatase
MPFSLFDAPVREPSQFVGFAGNVVDRQSENRADDSTAAALADPGARILLMKAGKLYLKAGEPMSAEFERTEAEALEAKLGEAVLLGWTAGAPWLAAPAGVDPEALPDTVKAIDYRSVHAQQLIDAEGLGALAQGAALLAWHASHGFCGRCGGRTEMRAGGYKRVCTQCQTEHFPRTDPVAIMLTVTRDRCILGRGAHFAPSMYSALAGFIEPGETIEAAVRRETLEESGIRLGRVAYHASQPWPFPYSLMIGCYGEALDEDIRFDARELQDCRWFPRDEVLDMLAGRHAGGLNVPPRLAIAHQLIRNWAESA